MRVEIGILAFLMVCWVAFFALGAAGYPLAGVLPISLYQLYSLAVFSGWVVGNVIVARSSGRPRTVRRKLLAGFLLCPGGLFYLLWALAPGGLRMAVPFAPLYAAIIFAIFFLVPVSFRRAFAPPRQE